ncbi:MAG TPA: hypothetical protein VIS48_00020 [Candidatus Kryptonia bacterium]
MSLGDIFKKPSVQAALVGALGGIAPKLIAFIPGFFNNVFPSGGAIIGMAVLAVLGAAIVAIYNEPSLHKALVLGAGAPAILGTLTANVANFNSSAATSFLNVPFASVAEARPETPADTIRIIISENASPYKLNSIWLYTDSKTTLQYQQNGDTLVAPVPQNTQELWICLPGDGSKLAVPISDILKSKCVHLRISQDKVVRDFWKTLGDVNLPKYKIENIGGGKP